VIREVLAAGICLVISRELAKKQPSHKRFVSGENVVIIDDPKDVESLSKSLGELAREPELPKAIGAAGLRIPDLVSERELAESYEVVFQHILNQEPDQPEVCQGQPTFYDPLDQLRNALPATAVLLGDAFRIAAGESSAVTGPAAIYESADRVSSWIMEHAETIDAATLQIVDFERNSLWTRTDLETEPSLLRFPLRTARAMRLSDVRSLRNCFPVRSRWIRIGHYRPDVADVISAVRRGREMPPACETVVPFLFVKKGDLMGTILRVTDEVLSMLALCDGQRSGIGVLEVISSGDEARRRSGQRALRRLVDEGAVRL